MATSHCTTCGAPNTNCSTCPYNPRRTGVADPAKHLNMPSPPKTQPGLDPDLDSRTRSGCARCLAATRRKPLDFNEIELFCGQCYNDLALYQKLYPSSWTHYASPSNDERFHRYGANNNYRNNHMYRGAGAWYLVAAMKTKAKAFPPAPAPMPITSRSGLSRQQQQQLSRRLADLRSQQHRKSRQPRKK